MYYLRYLLIILLLNCSSVIYSQLADFNFNAVATDETCSNNGIIVMTVSNTSQNAEINYKLFVAPDFTTAVAETLENSFSGLASGSYRIVASQILNGQSNSKQIDLVINDLVQPLDFQLIDSSGINCDSTASITVIVLSGNPTLYEIFAGPETRALQASNVFNSLPSGTYIVRVFDDCNDASSKSYTLLVGNTDLNVGTPVLSNFSINCTTVDVSNSISSSTTSPILYPLIVNYTVFAPDGSVAQTFVQNILTGPANTFQLTQTIALFGSQLFNVTIKITDNCNREYTNTFVLNPNPKLDFQALKGKCGALYFNLKAQNFVPPYSLNFTTPVDFNPSVYNAIYPAPYYTAEVIFGSEEITVPYGDYQVTIQDACGRTASLNFKFIKKELKPLVTTSNNGCDSSFGKVKIQLPDSRKIISISIIQAPLAYSVPLPTVVSAFLDSYGIYLQNDLPVGEYTYFFTDECGEVYTQIVKVPVFVFGQLSSVVRPDCSPTTGAVKLSTTNGALVSMIITAAPPAFNFSLPYTVSTNIDLTGVFYMSSLPAGSYTFKATDLCGFELQKTVDIVGYTSISNGFQLIRKCGAFNIKMNDTDNSITNKTFWLQKFFPATNSWGHPNTGVAFTEGSVPNATTARSLPNFSTVVNLFVLGEFRIIKVFDSFNNANPNGKCMDLYANFTIYPELVISGIYNLNCSSGLGPNNLVVDATGVEPFNFKITSPVVIDNGENNVFTNLAVGIYNLQVTDNCGTIKNISIEVGTLLPLSRANTPKNVLICRSDEVEFAAFPLINQTSQILGIQNPTIYNVTYHLSQVEADLGQNPLPDGFTNTSNPQTIYARVEHKTLTFCHATTSFALFVGMTPELTPTDPILVCNTTPKKLTADNGFEAYEWSTGETTQSIFVTQSGTYTVTVKNLYQDLSCSASKDFIVTSSSIASIDTITITDWTADKNTIVVNVSGLGEWLYSIDAINFQTSNTFTDLRPGIYTVYVKDNKGCGTAKDIFVLLYYPKYFTPNSDGYNDTWHVQFSSYEAHLNVDIFDRFGTFITRLKGGENGWDGTFNGQELPSTDYWFVVKREDGTIYKGHFSLKR